jgi:hypothetical protein
MPLNGNPIGWQERLIEALRELTENDDDPDR